MIKRYNRISLALGIPGIVLQCALAVPLPGALILVSVCIGLIGTALLISGLGYYAKAKGHSVAYGLLGLLSWLGIIILGLLRDRHRTQEEIQARRVTRPRDVVLGILLGLLLPIVVVALLALALLTCLFD